MGSDFDDRMQENCNKFYDVLDVLVTDDIDALDALKTKVDNFPNGQDSFTERHWITNAIGSGSLASVQWMVDQHVNLDFKDDEGWTVCMSSIDRDREDRHDILKILISAGADVNIRGAETCTPLHWAARRNDHKAIDILLAAGADPTIRTEIDEYATPEEEARIVGRSETADYIKKSLEERQK